MSSGMLSWLMRFAVIACAIGGVFLCVYGYPQLCGFFVDPLGWGAIPVFWLLLLWLYAVTIPCYAVLIMVWIVSIDVAKETVFSHRTAKLVGASSIIILADSAVLLLGTIILFLFFDPANMSMYLLLIVAAGFMLGIFAAVLARYVTKAVLLKEENEGTI